MGGDRQRRRGGHLERTGYSDRQDFENADRGLVGKLDPCTVTTDDGRSVWNTRWLLIIPAGTLHTDRNEGIQRFINGALRTDGTRDGNGVSDIKIFFQTYAYSGN
jgi:hypothetical protein